MENNITFDQLPEAVQQLREKLISIEQLLIELGNQSPPEQSEELLTITQAAELLNLTVPTVYSKVSRGELPVMKRGNRLYFSKLELMDYLRAGRKKSYQEVSAAADVHIKSRNS